MPELPEVEHASRTLRAALVGRTIASVRALHAAQKRTLPAAACRALAGARVASVTRRAKLQLAHFESGHTLEVHFRMNGDWDVGRADDGAPPHERVRIALTDGSRISLVDGRALSVVRLHAPGKFELPPLGPEPLDDAFDPVALRAALAKRRGPIKPVLLDQRVVAGLGNIYSAEALWEARIDPRAPANTLSAARVARLRDAIRAVLERAPAARYYAAEGRGSADDEGAWRVYGREGEPCARCGKAVSRIVQAARSTYFCAKCQR